ncbi:Fe-S cluster protein [Candidatus Micrarchaeota archaeon]|nr:Fe-S cluster protein [Candidatus Micrarchaeota archaeon]
MEEIYQEYIIELYKNPRNYGEIPDSERAEVSNPTCGDRITLFLKIRDGIVQNAKFTGHGCAISQASASLFTGFIRGKSLEELSGVGKEDVLSLLRIDLSRNPTRMRCALLPLDALKKLLKDVLP